MDWMTFCTIIGSGAGVAGFLYSVIRNFKHDLELFKNDINAKFQKHERRFEKIDQRLFLLCLGKDLPSILKAEKEEEKN